MCVVRPASRTTTPQPVTPRAPKYCARCVATFLRDSGENSPCMALMSRMQSLSHTPSRARALSSGMLRSCHTLELVLACVVTLATAVPDPAAVGHRQLFSSTTINGHDVVGRRHEALPQHGAELLVRAVRAGGGLQKVPERGQPAERVRELRPRLCV